MEVLDLRCRHLPGVTVLAIGGELDLTTSQQLVDRFRDVCRPGDQVIFDLAGVRFLDCCGLGALVRAYHEVRRDGGALHLAGLRRSPDHVVRLMRFDRLVSVHGDVRSAVVDVMPGGSSRRLPGHWRGSCRRAGQD